MKNAILKASSSKSSPKKTASPKKQLKKTKVIKKVKSIGKRKAKSATTSPKKKNEISTPKNMWDYFALDKKYKKLYAFSNLNSLIAALQHVRSIVEMSPTANLWELLLQLIYPLHLLSLIQANLSVLTMPAAVTLLVWL